MQKYSPMFAYVRMDSLNARKMFQRRPGSRRSNGKVTDEFRRGGHSGARLKMEQERLEREREKTEEEVMAHFQRWLKNPAVRDLICQDYVSPEERERRMREIFGRSPKSPEPAEPAAPDGTESNPVKPSQTTF